MGYTMLMMTMNSKIWIILDLILNSKQTDRGHRKWKRKIINHYIDERDYKTSKDFVI